MTWRAISPPFAPCFWTIASMALLKRLSKTCWSWAGSAWIGDLFGEISCLMVIPWTLAFFSIIETTSGMKVRRSTSFVTASPCLPNLSIAWVISPQRSTCFFIWPTESSSSLRSSVSLSSPFSFRSNKMPSISACSDFIIWRGLLISWAKPAAISPSSAKRPALISCSLKRAFSTSISSMRRTMWPVR